MSPVSVKRITCAVVLLVALISHTSGQTDYCEPTLCKNNLVHVGCGKSENYGPYCPIDRQLVPMTEEVKTYILDLHNVFRANVARGEVTNYSPASRMPTLIWDEELQKLAEYNVKTCIYGHDYCRNTKLFPLVGQNIAANSFYGMEVTPLDTMTELLHSWYAENENANQDYIDNYPLLGQDPPKDIGHFTQIVMDKATAVGCAMIQYTQNEQGHDWVHQNYVCNYSNSIARGHPVYIKGNPCELCVTGCSANYPGLCNIGEPVQPTAAW
ncbi:antigen 5 like allergen Cul n 1 [Anopheles gambiae]|uniref:Venom allergen-1 n=3 Tax=gambiae species complex TaxID=44542 RepID=A0A1S4GXB4_ANOGA|nr:antigen 5 like allergen Cul n 1-like [Anopheles coluzzii]XP_061516719.1 antigen 5 like allergen Cul n 1 [Anopheles gambiae]